MLKVLSHFLLDSGFEVSIFILIYDKAGFLGTRITLHKDPPTDFFPKIGKPHPAQPLK